MKKATFAVRDDWCSKENVEELLQHLIATKNPPADGEKYFRSKPWKYTEEWDEYQKKKQRGDTLLELLNL